jgi:hypothetical protein
MLSLRSVGDGKKLAMYMENTPENRDKAMLVMGAILNGDLTEITTLNELSQKLTTHLSYMSEKFEWQERRIAELTDSYAALVKKLDEMKENPVPQALPEPAVPKRKVGRPSKAQIQEWNRLYGELTDLHWDYAVAKGYDTKNPNSMTCAWTNIYQGHRRKTGYYPRQPLKHPSFGSDTPTKLARCIFDGYGESLAEYIREEIASPKGEIVLRLNPDVFSSYQNQNETSRPN